ncbi:MAG: histidine kinase dimerization/phospho-acceptor domain-containing protein, partial [Steroidobacteraceae bacterium]
DETRRRFLADVSHELRTPLTVMRGEAEVALRDRNGVLGDGAREALAAVELYQDAGLRERARVEFEAAIGPDFRYTSLLGDRPPPLDYRN